MANITLAEAQSAMEAALSMPENALTTNSWERKKGHIALSVIFEKFLRLSRIRLISSTTTTTASTATASLSAVTAFERTRVVSVTLTNGGSKLVPLFHRDREYILKQNELATSGEPEFYCYDDETTIRFAPTPDAVYTVTFRMIEPLTTFTLGTADATTLNIPKEFALELIYRLAAPLVGSPDPTRLISSPAWAEAERWCKSLRPSEGATTKYY